jgi:hypothetical protein
LSCSRVCVQASFHVCTALRDAPRWALLRRVRDSRAALPPRFARASPVGCCWRSDAGHGDAGRDEGAAVACLSGSLEEHAAYAAALDLAAKPVRRRNRDPWPASSRRPYWSGPLRLMPPDIQVHPSGRAGGDQRGRPWPWNMIREPRRHARSRDSRAVKPPRLARLSPAGCCWRSDAGHCAPTVTTMMYPVVSLVERTVYTVAPDLAAMAS